MTGRREETRPLLVGSSGARDLDALANDVRTAPREVDLLEVRLDRFPDPAAIDLEQLAGVVDRPAVLTLRPESEGGEYAGDTSSRLALLERAEAAGFAWIDVEADLAAELPRGAARRIVSWHGATDGTDGATRAQALFGLDGDVFKVAAAVEDAAAALRFVRDAVAAGQAARRPTVVIAMGPAGRWLRPLAGKLGMPLLYAALNPSRKTAAGQLTVAELLEVYRAPDVRPDTNVFAVAGSDVSASLSPRAHNRTFAAARQNCVYVDISTGAFQQVAEVAEAVPLSGLSITAPFKADALAFAAGADADAKAMEVANTLARSADGRCFASNTDAPGFLAALDLALREPERVLDVVLGRSLDALALLDGTAPPPSGRREIETALVFGTGGVARAVAWGLRQRRVRVFVTGRSQAKATALVLGLGGGIEAISPGRATSLTFDLLVKAVPDRSWDDLPLDPFDFNRAGFAADVVYSPIETNFLLAARRAGRRTIPGLLMFSEQAVLQSARFTGLDPATVRPWVVEGIRGGVDLGARRAR